MGELINLPLHKVRHPGRDAGPAKLDYPLTEVSVHFDELTRLRSSIDRFFKSVRGVRRHEIPKRECAEIRKKVGIAQTELNKGPGSRQQFPFFVNRTEWIDLPRIMAGFEKLECPPDGQLDYFFNCLPNFMTGDGVFAVPIVYFRENDRAPMPTLVADMELDFKEMTRAAVRRIEFEKTSAGYFQMALLYKLLVEPEGLIGINPVYDWEGVAFPGRERMRNWLQNISSTISRADFALLWNIDSSPAVWHAGGRALAKFDVLEPNCGFFRHYCFFRSGRVVDSKTLALVRIEPSIIF